MLWPLLLPARAYLVWSGNTEREELKILHGLEKFYHYCFVCKVHVITDHNSLVAKMGKDVTL